MRTIAHIAFAFPCALFHSRLMQTHTHAFAGIIPSLVVIFQFLLSLSLVKMEEYRDRHEEFKASGDILIPKLAWIQNHFSYIDLSATITFLWEWIFEEMHAHFEKQPKDALKYYQLLPYILQSLTEFPKHGFNLNKTTACFHAAFSTIFGTFCFDLNRRMVVTPRGSEQDP